MKRHTLIFRAVEDSIAAENLRPAVEAIRLLREEIPVPPRRIRLRLCQESEIKNWRAVPATVVRQESPCFAEGSFRQEYRRRKAAL
jgi:hypothetical protein